MRCVTKLTKVDKFGEFKKLINLFESITTREDAEQRQTLRNGG